MLKIPLQRTKNKERNEESGREVWRYLSTKYIQKLGMTDNGGLSGIHPSRILDIDMYNNSSLHKTLGFQIEAA